MSSTISFVNDKTPGVFLYEQRALADGETPKHAGQTFVNEASRILNPEFLKDLSSGALVASWKIDGSCCRIDNPLDRTTSDCVEFTYYRRRDLHTGKDMPDGATPGVMIDGKANVCWIKCKNIGEDKFHMSALECDEFGEIVGIWSVNKFGEPFVIPLNEIKSGTYELVGSKVPTDIYRLPDVKVTVNVKGKPCTVPRHYLVPHGVWQVENQKELLEMMAKPNALELVRQFIISNQVEGIVFKNTVDTSRIFKVNRGHIAVKIDYKNDQLYFCGKSEREIDGTNGWNWDALKSNPNFDWSMIYTQPGNWADY